MNDQQLYFAIGVPMLFNLALYVGFTYSMNRRFEELKQAINHRFDDAEKVWRAELKRVEEILDARLKHLEDR